MGFFRATLVGIAAGSVLVHPAWADTHRISVPSGVKQHVHTYRHWSRKDCSAQAGVVRVVTKPEHGTLIPRQIDTTIGRDRFNPNDISCWGRPIKGFEVEYQSKPGFHGWDTFTIETTYGKRQAIDVYLVTIP